MKLQTNKSVWLEIFISTIYFFAIELLFRIVLSYSLFSWSTLRILFSSFLIVCMWNLLFSFFHNKRVLRISNMFLLLIASIYAIAQAGFGNFLGIFVSVGTSSQLGAVTSYIRDFIHSLKPEFYFIFIPFFCYMLYVLIITKKEENSDKPSNLWRGKTRLALIILGVIVSLGYCATININFMQNPLQLIANHDLFLYPSNSSIAVNQFGPSVYGILDIKNLFFPYHDNQLINVDLQEKNKNSRNIDDTKWKKLITETTDTSYQNLNNYFINQKISAKNDFTGKFKDKNVIVMMMESVNTIIENKDYFPNFAKLLEHGWYWENHYSPRNSCATINNELSGLTSLYTINQVCTANAYKENTYFTSLFNLFKKKDYYVSSYHDYNEEYYARHEIHKNLGSEAYYDVTDLDIPIISDWPNDADFVEQIMPYFTAKDKFFTWITTMSPHQPYSVNSELGSLYADLFEDTNYTESAKRYLSKVKVTDDALGALLDGLEEAGVLEDTVIVLYGDHYPYALLEEDLKPMMDYDYDVVTNRDKTPFLIYQADLEPQVFSEYTSYINLAPTLANLFDLDYDPRLYTGYDVLAEDYDNRIVFSDGSWLDENAYYDAATSEIEYKTDVRYDTEKLQEINQTVNNKIKMSNLAITTNYFDYLKEIESE